MVEQMRAHRIFLVLFGPASQSLCIWGLLKAIIGPGPYLSRYHQKRNFFQPGLPKVSAVNSSAHIQHTLRFAQKNALAKISARAIETGKSFPFSMCETRAKWKTFFGFGRFQFFQCPVDPWFVGQNISKRGLMSSKFERLNIYSEITQSWGKNMLLEEIAQFLS